MTATWTAPTTTHVAGDVWGATEVNNLGNDLLYLRDGIHASGKYDKGSDITTTSTSFAAIDSTNLAKTVTLVGTKALVFFVGTALSNAGAQRIDFDINVNGTRWGSSGTEGLYSITPSTAQAGVTVAALVDGLTPGSNTFQIMWKVSAGTGTLRAGAGVAGQDFIPSFNVMGW